MAGAFFARSRREEGAGLCPVTDEQRRDCGNKPGSIHSAKRWFSLPKKMSPFYQIIL